MNKKEAREALQAGKKLTHISFKFNEYIEYMRQSDYYRTEYGMGVDTRRYWATRTEPKWETDWEVFEQLLTVNLTYFKSIGKFYSHGSYDVSADTPLHDIFDEVRNKLRLRELPGLCVNHSGFIVHVNVPEHKNNYPCLIIPD